MIKYKVTNLKTKKVYIGKTIKTLNEDDLVGESIQDSYGDLSVYGIIAQIVKNGKWAK